jgi:[protein-PII] uridylyltransferase
LLRVRNELHYLNKNAKPTPDTLVLAQQFQLATRLKYPQKNPLRRSEAFMRDYYQHARVIYNTTELLAGRLYLPPPTPADQPKRNGLLKILRRTPAPPQVEKFDGFYSANGMLYAEARDVFNQDSARLMRLFQHLQSRDLRMSPQLEQLVCRRMHLVDRTFQYAKSTRETFLAILARKGRVGATLRAMHRVDFLGRYLPEFGQLTCLVQHEFFHRYTADEHTLVCIDKLDQVIDTTDPKLANYREIFLKLADPAILYLALLLHDTGKATNVRSHSEASAFYAQKVARRLQLAAEQRRALVLLVDHHILMSSTAQRRNLDDPATIAEFAALVRNQANLDALMLLTLADGQGTGDENWSDWKESLVWQLYRETTDFLADGAAFYSQRTIERAALQDAVSKKLPEDFREEIEAHFESMPDRYFHTYSVSEIIQHILHFRKFFEGRDPSVAAAIVPAIKWIPHPESGHSEVWFCGWDRRELLARIAGSFSCAQLNILSADIFTRSDGLVLDIFRVCNTRQEAVTDQRDVATVAKRLTQALMVEDFDFTSELSKVMKRRDFHLVQELEFPTRLTIDHDCHPVYTVVEVQTPDRLGLLYRLLRCFGAVHASIALARIATEKGAANDSFYVTDEAGKKLKDQASLKRLGQELTSVTQTTG